MDPISITCIVVAGGIVITSMGRFISKKYHSYKSHSNEHGLEMISEETSVDGAHKKTTLKIHGNSHDLNVIGALHKEHGDPEAVKALSSLSMILSGALGSNHTTTSIDSMASTATDASKSKDAIALDVKTRLSSAVHALKSQFSNQKGNSFDKKADIKISPDSVADRDIELPVNLVNNFSCDNIKSVSSPSGVYNHQATSSSFLSSMSKNDIKICTTCDNEAKEGDEDGAIVVVMHRKNVAESKLCHTRSYNSDSAEYFDARERDDDDFSLASTQCTGGSEGYFSNEF